MKDKIILGLSGLVIIIGGGALCKEMISINKHYKEDKEILEAIFNYIQEYK